MRKQKEKYEQSHKVINNIVYKLCSICTEWFEMNKENFYKNKSNTIDGFNPYCKQCCRNKTKKWQEENEERYYAYIRDRSLTPSTKRLRALRDVSKKRRLNGKYKAWLNTETGKISIKQSIEKRKKKAHEITEDQWKNCMSYFENACAYCGKSYEDNYEETLGVGLSKEHVDPEGANDLSNCVPACRTCNSSKKSKSILKWYTEQKTFYDSSREKRIHNWLNGDYRKYL